MEQLCLSGNPKLRILLIAKPVTIEHRDGQFLPHRFE